MDKILEITLLYDFYGELLTERQKEMFEMYYLNDLSLSEIGEQLNISRQAVRDSLKHSKKALLMYEDKLGLVNKFSQQKLCVMKINEIINQIEEANLLPELSNHIKQIKEITNEFIYM